MEQYLKEIAKELKLIRKELQLENDLHMQEMGMDEQQEREPEPNKPSISEQLNSMFNEVE